MHVTRTELLRHFSELSDKALAGIDPRELTDEARTAHENEMRRRGVVSGLSDGAQAEDKQREEEALIKKHQEQERAFTELKQLVATQFPSRQIVVIACIEWIMDYGLIGNSIRAVGKIGLSAALGMSGPWLLAFGGNSANSGILVLFENEEVALLFPSGKSEIVTALHVLMDFEPPEGIRIDNGFSLTGTMSLAKNLGEANIENAKLLIQRIHQSKPLTHEDCHNVFMRILQGDSVAMDEIVAASRKATSYVAGIILEQLQQMAKSERRSLLRIVNGAQGELRGVFLQVAEVGAADPLASFRIYLFVIAGSLGFGGLLFVGSGTGLLAGIILCAISLAIISLYLTIFLRQKFISDEIRKLLL